MARPDRLPCGTSIDGLLAQVADQAPPRDPAHQRSCPHCRATVAEIHLLWAPLRELATDQPLAPRSLRSAVMNRVRGLPRTAWHAVIAGDRGATYVAARVVATVVRRAADGIPSIALAFGRGRSRAQPPRPDEASRATRVGVAGSSVVLDVVVVVRFGAHIPTLSQQLRARISQHVTDLVGLAPSEINIEVVDVQPDV